MKVSKMKTKYYPLLIFLLVASLWIPASAQTDAVEGNNILLSPLSISAAMLRNGTTSVTIDVQITNLEEFSIPSVSFRIDSLEMVIVTAILDGELVEYSISQMERHSMISLYPSEEIESNESRWAHIELISIDLQTEPRIGDNEEFIEGRFVFYMRPHSRVVNFTFVTILPSHASLTHESVVPVFPVADGNFTNGESMAFFWITDQLEPGQERAFIVKFNLLNVEHTESGLALTSTFVVGGFGIIIGIFSTIGIPMIIRRVKQLRQTHYVGLTTEEEEILSILGLNDGSCSQKDIHTTMIGVSESKISLLLGNLEERGMIRRFREGRENIVHLLESEG